MMIDPLSKTVPQQERLSLPALVTVGVIHLGVLWLMLQAASSVQVTRNVVYQLLSPITRLREPVPAVAVVAPKAVREVRGPISSTNAIQQHKPVELPPERPVERAVEQPVEKVRTKVVEKVTDFKPVQLAQEAVPVVLPPPVMPPPPVPVPVPEPVPIPEPVPAPAPAPARALAITPVEKPAAAANAQVGGPSTGGASTSPPPAGGAPGGSGVMYPDYMKMQPRQKSFSELANEQLNPGGRKDKFVAAMEDAHTPDCLGTNQTGRVSQGQVNFNGLFAAPAIAAQALQGKCK